MRATRLTLLIGGIVFVVLGGPGALWALTTDSDAALGVGIAGVVFVVVGVILILCARYMSSLDTSGIIRDGVPGMAEVLWTHDTGVTINNVNLVVAVGLRVTAPGRPAPYEVTVKHVLRGRNAWGSVQPGMTVPVRIDRDDPQKVAIDESGQAARTMGPAPTAAEPQIVAVRAADITAIGAQSYGQVVSVEQTGITAGQVSASLPAHQADDPVVRVVFTYVGPNGTQLSKEALIRVPDGKHDVLAPGRAIPVSYVPSSPETATIDWSRT